MRFGFPAGVLLALTLSAQNTPHLDVPYVPSPNVVVEGMLKLAGVKATDTVYDLGCGDGRIVIMAAEKFGATAVGVDLDADLVREARERAKKAGVAAKVRFMEGDLFEADIRPATAIMLYLIPKLLPRLRPKLQSELKPGSRIVSFAFPFPDWPPDKAEDVNGRHIYLYKIAGPAK